MKAPSRKKFTMFDGAAPLGQVLPMPFPEARRKLDPNIPNQFSPEAAWRPPSLADLPTWKGRATAIGLDTETKDPDIMTLGPGVRREGSRLVGASIAFLDGPKIYLPWGHEGGDNLPKENCIQYLKDNFKDWDGDVVGANLPYELDWLWQEGVAMPMVHRFRDVQVADPLLYELHDRYSLEEIAKRWELPGKNEEALRAAARFYGIDPKKDLYRMPARYVGPYAEDDALRPLQIYAKQLLKIEEENIAECWDMECRLLPVLVRMQRRGVEVDTDRLEQVSNWTKNEEAKHTAIIAAETGVKIPPGEMMNVALLADALRVAGLPIGSNQNGDAVNKELLAGNKHPVAVAILAARAASTMRTTFVEGVRRHIVTKNGVSKIHCNFNQIRKVDDKTDEASGVAYGRLSASHPNMQNQPGAGRGEGDPTIGPRWRCIYKAGGGRLWVSNDLKQQEPKWSFHYGALLEGTGVGDEYGIKGAKALCAALCENPMLDTYDPLAEQAGVPRPKAKIMWLARAYGQGDGTLCEGLGLPTQMLTYSRRLWKKVPADSPEGEEAIKQGGFTWKGAGPEGMVIIETFDSAMPFLKGTAKLAEDQAKERGWVKLISGRRCHFERTGSNSFDWTTRKAFNRIIQGTAAEQTKRIMLAVAETEFEDSMLLQVHDEIDFGLESHEDGLRVAEIMKHAVPMLVPTVVDTESGPTWGESMSVESMVDGKKIKRKWEWDL